MGFFDIIYVCPQCREGIKTSETICPYCGSELLNSHNYPMLPKKWDNLDENEKIEHIKNVIADCLGEVVELDSYDDSFEQYITTTQTLLNYNIEEYCGTVSGTDIYLVGGTLGGGLVNQEKLFDAAFAEAKKKMFLKARGLGGNAVIGMNVSFTSPGNLNNMIVLVTGTAVKLADEE